VEFEMKLQQIVVTEQGDEWSNLSPPESAKSIRKKMLSLDHQADLMMTKLQYWVKDKGKGKVFTVTGVKTGLQAPKQVKANPRQYMAWTLTSSNPNVVTKVFADKDDPRIVLPIRALVNRHNDLTNARADMEGRLAKIKAAKLDKNNPLIIPPMDASGSMTGK
jgi:hypothetical protein